MIPLTSRILQLYWHVLYQWTMRKEEQNLGIFFFIIFSTIADYVSLLGPYVWAWAIRNQGGFPAGSASGPELPLERTCWVSTNGLGGFRRGSWFLGGGEAVAGGRKAALFNSLFFCYYYYFKELNSPFRNTPAFPLTRHIHFKGSQQPQPCRCQRLCGQRRAGPLSAASFQRAATNVEVEQDRCVLYF